jgi:hypothetical protein
MNASQITASLNKWNLRQELRQELTNKNRETLKSALKRSMVCELKNTQIWASAMLFKN